MLLGRFYYRVKPLMPYRVRYAIRRWLAKRKLGRNGLNWPINEQAGATPSGWPGWPEGKEFAFVLTHDVEGPNGLARCRQLAAVEMELGFRSSFNFIPEGDYQLSREVRAHLVENDFEVGVHDLHHDGHLYQSRQSFEEKAVRINRYLREWKAVGFRSGFMHHNYEWLHDLDVLYDASSFDTDPFEPQPDAVHTIFPFSMQNAEGHTYIELPYTLAQDSTLFLILQEKSDAIWRRKLDWIVERGGMALMNVHPDYTCFDGCTSSRTFPVSYYRDFLQYVKSRYAGRYWHGAPRALATYCRDVGVPLRSTRTRRRICMVSASIYERDNRVIRYARTLIDRGDSVDVIALPGSESSPRRETVDGANVYRVGHKSRGGQLSQLFAAAKFLLLSSVHLTRNHLKARYDMVHVHNMPDFLVFAAWLPKLTGAGVILDIHDIFPEFYATRFGSAENGLLPRSLRLLERWCAAFADHVIISNHLWRDTFAARSASSDKCSVFINSVDSGLFRPTARTKTDQSWVIIYPGSFNRHQGLDLAIRAVSLVKEQVPGVELHLYGLGPVKSALVSLAEELKLNGSVRFFEPVPLTRMPEILANADVGVVPKRASDFFGNQAFSTKIMEFMAQGVPVVVSRTLIDSYYYNDKEVRFFESENVSDLAQALIELAKNQAVRSQFIRNGHDFVARNSWDTKKQSYLKLVDSLVL